MPVQTLRVDKKPGEAGWHSEKQRLEAFALYMTLGNMTLVSDKLNIPVKTLYKWKYSPWWKQQIQELEQGNRIKLGTKIANILSKASVSLEDRLDNGDLYFDYKTKTLERRPMSTKNITEIMRAGVAVQDMVIKAEEAFERKDNMDKKQQEQINKLNEIARMLSGRKEEPKVIDVITEEIQNAEQP